MPYESGDRQSAERASRIGHLDVIKSELVQKTLKKYQEAAPEEDVSRPKWNVGIGGSAKPEEDVKPLNLIFSVDGSMQIENIDDIPRRNPLKRVSFIKTVLVRLDQPALAKVDKIFPHPFDLRDILKDSAVCHTTTFPLKNIRLPSANNCQALREIIFDSINDPALDGHILETLKWFAFEKWTESGGKDKTEDFLCPHCRGKASVPRNSNKGACQDCNGEVFITDFIGFQRDMGDDYAPDRLVTAYMNVHEFLLLFTPIRHYWEHNRDLLKADL